MTVLGHCLLSTLRTNRQTDTFTVSVSAFGAQWSLTHSLTLVHLSVVCVTLTDESREGKVMAKLARRHNFDVAAVAAVADKMKCMRHETTKFVSVSLCSNTDCLFVINSVSVCVCVQVKLLQINVPVPAH